MKKTIIWNILLIICVSLWAPRLNAQATAIAHREFDADDWLSSSLNLEDKGILLFGWEEKTKFAMKAVNTDLEDFASWSIATEKKASLTDIVYDKKGERILVLIKASKVVYNLTVIDIASKKKKTTALTFPKGTSLRDAMYLVGDDIWFVGYTKKAYFMFKSNIGSPKLTPMDPHITGEKFSINTIDNLGEGEIAISFFYGPKKQRELDAIVLDEQGKVVVKSLLSTVSAEQRQQIIDASITRLGAGDYAVTGTYNKKGKGTGNGVYFARYSEDKVRYLSNFDYSDFEHFFDYLSDKRREKVEAKIAKKKGKGKDVTVSSLSIMHKAVIIEDGLVFIGEYYYPTYRTETYTTVSGGRTVTQTRQVFDGYQYTHGLAVGIDNNGKKLYDLSIPLHIPYKPFYAKRFLRIYSDSQVIHMVHTSGVLIYSSKIDGNNITNNEYSFITKIPQNQREKWTSSTSLYWYSNFYFVMEVQRTKEKGLGGKKQTKYYAVKVEVQE